MRLSILALLVLTACPASDTEPNDTDTGVVIDDTAAPTDVDGDGFDVAAGDCNDADATIHPGAEELCNAVDDDCDTIIDPATSIDAVTWYADADADGFGDSATFVAACDAPAGYIADATDCDDAVASIFPGAVEICDDVDNDCDGAVDPATSIDAATWYFDLDGDGFGDSANSARSCDGIEGFVALDGDCDDADSRALPGAPEVCDGIDNDCDHIVDPVTAVDVGTWFADADRDGFGDAADAVIACDVPVGYVLDATDCDDADAAYNPGVVEADCTDPTDYNCDGSVGYADADSDGIAACEDCNDSDATVFPGAIEVCDAVDNDCDGVVDPSTAVDVSTWYFDADGDGFGDLTDPLAACDLPAGYTTDATDCDDNAASTFPGATEICDTVDNDCDGTVDPSTSTDAVTWYADVDADGFGDPSVTTDACDAPIGFIADATDCDDAVSGTFPGATEMCDAVDNDCDGTVDPSTSTDAMTWYADADADGFGNVSETVAACDAPAGFIADATDCDDTDAGALPGGEEVCDGTDNDCDGTVDPSTSIDALTWYADADADGFGDVSITTNACEAPAGFIADATDCDDAASSTFPGATEMCDAVDNDCDGTVDPSTSTDAMTWYADADADGFGDASDSQAACSAPSGYIADATDCDGTDAAVFPGADEFCNTTDDDCDGTVDEDALDTVIFFQDLDGDGVGTTDDTTLACDAAEGYAATDGDCDDDDIESFPGAEEVCDDGIDQDCSGIADDDAACYGCHEAEGYLMCDPLPWDAAAEVCAALGTQLVTIDNAAENDALAAAMRATGRHFHWLGLSDLAVEGEFVWEDGTLPAYTNWVPGEPNNDGGNEHCAVIYGEVGDWNDAVCSGELDFACE